MRSPLKFRHGVHPHDFKELTAALPIRRLPFPDDVVLPLSQHTGKPAVPVVRVGDRVERGDKVADADGFVSAPVHASVSGTIAEIGRWPHPNGGYSEAVRIEVEPFSAQVPRPRMIPSWEDLTPEEIIAAVKEAGVVGLGGAAFPTHVKLTPPKDVKIEVLVINGCECEPYLTTDHRIMVEYPERAHLGIRLMMRCLGVERALIGIEKNKPDAVEAMRATLPSDIDVAVLPLRVRYPQGAEKMLIKAVLNREVPSGKLPLHVGVVVQNVGSVATIAEAFETGLPLVERIVTVTGPGVREPANLIVPVGTRLRYLLDACGGLADEARVIVNGGPMMGASQGNLDAPVLKGTTGVVVLTEAEHGPRAAYPCVRCGACLEACPVFLNPQRLGKLAMTRRYEEMKDHHLFDCMLCGCCSYVCPSNIPLSQLFAISKSALA
ncbi:MAG: electron transport complex subunit RsxC [bacterium]|nr:electron transport complex subunit RsxC [bacterium]